MEVDIYLGRTKAHDLQKHPMGCLFIEYDESNHESMARALGPDTRFYPEITNQEIRLVASQLGYRFHSKYSGNKSRLGACIRELGWPAVALVEPPMALTPLRARLEPGAVVIPLPAPQERKEPKQMDRRQGYEMPHYTPRRDGAARNLYARATGGAMARETTETIRAWALATFGPPRSALSVVDRAQKELDELREAAVEGAPPERLAEEASDVVIVLCRLFGWDDVERKMLINRARRWILNGEGHGQHVPD